MFQYVQIQEKTTAAHHFYVRLSRKSCSKALELLQHAKQLYPFYFFLSKQSFIVSFPHCHCFVIAQQWSEACLFINMRNKRNKQKELGRQTSLDPIFRGRLPQKIFFPSFVISCVPSQPSKIEADVRSFVLSSSFSVSADLLSTIRDK